MWTGSTRRTRRRNPDAERYAELDYDAAASASAGLIQPKAIAAAKAAGIIVEVAAMGAARMQRAYCSSPARKAPARQIASLAGCLAGLRRGWSGRAGTSSLSPRPIRELNPVLVRHPQARAHVHGVTFTSQLEHALAHQPDLVVELPRRPADAPAEIMAGALAAGAQCRHGQQGGAGAPL